jgi:hypothetical protein
MNQPFRTLHIRRVVLAQGIWNSQSNAEGRREIAEDAAKSSAEYQFASLPHRRMARGQFSSGASAAPKVARISRGDPVPDMFSTKSDAY